MISEICANPSRRCGPLQVGGQAALLLREQRRRREAEEGIDTSQGARPPPGPRPPKAQGMVGMAGLQGTSVTDSLEERSVKLGAMVGNLEIRRDALEQSERLLSAEVLRLQAEVAQKDQLLHEQAARHAQATLDLEAR
eukprot:364046-Prymnesium_polylepis.1